MFDETRKYWFEPVLTANMLASSKLARQVTSKAFNPTYTFTSSMESFSEGEVAAPVIAFGNTEDVTVDRSLVEYFFSKSLKLIMVTPGLLLNQVLIPGHS